MNTTKIVVIHLLNLFYSLVKIKKIPSKPIDYTKQFPDLLVKEEFIEVYAVEENGILMTIFPSKRIQDGTKNYNPKIVDVRKFVLNNESLYGIEKKEVTPQEVATYLNFLPETNKRQQIANVLEYEKSTIEYVQEQYKKLLETERVFREIFNKKNK